MSSLTLPDVQQAARILEGVVHKTPVLSSRQLNHLADAQVFLKCENFQRVGAFKFRGAYHAIARLSPEEKKCPIITASSGNHAQGVALACQLQHFAAHIVMPEPVNPLKHAAVVGYGATVHTVAHRSMADREADRLVHTLNGVSVHPFNHPHVIAGQGTATLELLEEVPDLEVILAPVGGGGLLSGACIAAHGLKESIQLYACEPAGALDALYSVQENRVVPMENPCTIAEGLRTSLGDVTLPLLRDHLAGFFVVQEGEILQAMQLVFERLKIVIEASSAVALAPLLRREPTLKGKRVGVIITGGNVDLSTYFQTFHDHSETVMDRGLYKNPWKKDMAQ